MTTFMGAMKLFGDDKGCEAFKDSFSAWTKNKGRIQELQVNLTSLDSGIKTLESQHSEAKLMAMTSFASPPQKRNRPNAPPCAIGWRWLRFSVNRLPRRWRPNNGRKFDFFFSTLITPTEIESRRLKFNDIINDVPIFYICSKIYVSSC